MLINLLRELYRYAEKKFLQRASGKVLRELFRLVLKEVLEAAEAATAVRTPPRTELHRVQCGPHGGGGFGESLWTED